MRAIPLAILACLTLPIPAYAVNCGDILGPGGVYTLTNTLDCQDSAVPGLTVLDGATLDLNGHRVGGSFEPAILLEGTGAVLRNGSVGRARGVAPRGWPGRASGGGGDRGRYIQRRRD